MGLVLLLVLAGVIAGGVWAVKNLPWWVNLSGVVAVFLLAKWMMKRAFVALLTVPFKMKGSVLRGAVVEVHSVMPAPTPAEDAARRYFRVEVSVRPTRQGQGFQHWEPCGLVLVMPESRLNPHSDTSDDDDACEVKRVEVQQEGVFQDDEGWKVAGPQRLRLLIAVKPGVSSLKFRYYFEEFGQMRLPAESASGLLRSTG